MSVKCINLVNYTFCRCQTVVTQEDMYSHVLSVFVESKVKSLLLISSHRNIELVFSKLFSIELSIPSCHDIA